MARLRFRKGELDQAITTAALSIGQFARRADIGVETLRRARKGRLVRSRTFGRILIALGNLKSE